MGKFVHRVGSADLPRFGGVRRECDPGAIPAHMFRDGINLRYERNMLVPRGGQKKLNASALSGGIMGIFCGEFQFVSADDPVAFDTLCGEAGTGLGGASDIGIPELYLLTGNSNEPGFYYFSEEQFPRVRRQPYDTAADLDTVAACFDDGVVWVLGLDGAGSNFLVKVFTQGGTPMQITSASRIGNCLPASVERFKGFTYFGVGSQSVDADSRIYRYAGLGVLTEVDTPGRMGAPYLRTLGDFLYSVHGGYDVFIGAGGGKMRRMTAAGVWSDLTMSDTTFQAVGAPVEYNGKLYTVGFKNAAASQRRAAACSIVGTTVTTERDLGGADGSFYGFPCIGQALDGNVGVLQDFLYYLYHPAGTSNFFLGRFDGTTWNDTYYDIGAQFGTSEISGFLTTAGANMDMRFFDGKLRLVMRKSTGTCAYGLFSSGLNAAGAFVLVQETNKVKVIEVGTDKMFCPSLGAVM
jgi:hypothetical protein